MELVLFSAFHTAVFMLAAWVLHRALKKNIVEKAQAELDTAIQYLDSTDIDAALKVRDYASRVQTMCSVFTLLAVLSLIETLILLIL